MVRHWFVAAAAFALVGLAAPAHAAGDADAGKAKAAKCFACHPADGTVKKNNPPLAGLSLEEHVKAMQDYKSGAREHVLMKKLAAAMSDEDIADVAAFYATLK